MSWVVKRAGWKIGLKIRTTLLPSIWTTGLRVFLRIKFKVNTQYNLNQTFLEDPLLNTERDPQNCCFSCASPLKSSEKGCGASTQKRLLCLHLLKSLEKKRKN